MGGATVAIDTYFLNNSLAEELLLPVKIPIGFFAIFVFAVAIAALVVKEKWPEPAAGIEEEIASLREDMVAQSVTIESLKRDRADLTKQLKKLTSLKTRVTALLIPSNYGLTLRELMDGLGLSNSNNQDRAAVLSVLAWLEEERGFDFSLSGTGSRYKLQSS